ncbi:MAG: MFS transporter [Myxococcota bacterium]
MSTEIAVPAPSAGTYRGWWVLSATFACAMLVIGATNYAFGLFVVPVQAEFGLSRAAVNQGMSLFMIGGALWAPIAGRILDRFPAPLVMTLGGGALGLGMAGIAASSSLTAIAVALAGPMALGAMCAGGLANTTIVSRWFRRRRGRALGIATVSSGAGGFVMVQLITALIGRHGWRAALAATGAIVALGVAALALGLVRSRPDEEALERAGEIGPEAEDSATTERRFRLGELVRMRNFWCIAFGTGLLMASDGALLASKMPYLLGLGIEAQSASFLIACMTASSVAGKIGIGLAADRMDLRRLYGIVAACHVVLLLVLIAEPGYGVLLFALSLFGVGVGGVYPLLATLTAQTFGSASYGSVAGTMQLVALQPLSIALVTFIGASHDRTGSYTLAFEVFIGLVFLAGGLIALVKLPPRVADARPEVA